jgi:UDP-galactopyranose mutase
MTHLLEKTVRSSQIANGKLAQADLVRFLHLRRSDMFPRPRHLKTAWGQERRVFYIGEHHLHERSRGPGVQQAAPNLRVVTPYLLTWEPEEKPYLIELCKTLFPEYAIFDYIFRYYSPMFIHFIRDFQSLYGENEGEIVSLLSQTTWDATWAWMKSLIQAELEKQGSPSAFTSLAVTPDDGTAQNNLSDGIPDSDMKKNIKLITADDFLPTRKPKPGNGNGHKPRPFDFLIVGAGFAGSVLAERLARGSGQNVLVIDQRNHIAGNAYDHYDQHGLLVHKYGPHIFHTNSKEVFAYLSQFTEWRPYEHRVRASVDGQLVPIPINLDTVNLLYGLNLTSFELQDWFDSVAEQVEQIKTSEDVVVSKVGHELYEKFFRNYTRKQWGLDPSELDASVTARVPVRLNRDDRYFGDTFQSMPRYGYTKMFENILDHPRIKVMLNTSYRDIVDMVPHRKVIFTGPVDEYFDHRFGRLPYRSLEFEFRTFDENLRQPVAVINYPNEHAYTRATEFKHLTGQEHHKTSIVYEYPCSNGDPYYPIPRPENAELYKKYKQLAEATPDVYFAGRLGTYRYYNMDQVTAQALSLYARIMGLKKNEAAGSFTPARFQIDIPCPLLVTQVID